MYSDPRDPWLVIFRLISYLCLVLCCDIYRDTLISIMYPACMITVNDRKSRVLHYNTSCNCEMRWDGDGDGADVGDDVDDDLDDAREDDDDDGDDLPGGICPPEMAFLLCRFPPRGGGETRKLFSFQVFTPGGSYRREGAPRGATRHPGGCLAWPGGGPRQTPFCLPGGSPHLHPR